jgi:DNA processing protein
MRYYFVMDRRTEAIYLLAMARNFEPRHHDMLAGQLGSIEAVLTASEDELRRLRLPGSMLTRLIEARAAADPAAELAALRERGITALAWGSPDFPELLGECADTPLLLFVLGDPHILHSHGNAIVGSRKCSEHGIRNANTFGRELASLGLPVVSGLALGVDGAAHSGALDSEGPTVAVLGCGVDVLYPPEHRELYLRIAEKGAVVSEYAPGTEPRKEHFPQRNRIISGLSRGTLVVEAPMGSGALITARLAIEQGREVFAIPGPIGSPYVKGCHSLIKSGQAKLVENVDDILSEYGTNRASLRREQGVAAMEAVAAGGEKKRRANEQPPGLTLSEQPEGQEEESPALTPAGISAGEARVLECLSYEGTHVNELVRRMGITTSDCIAHLTMLEIRGLISSASGGYYVRL